MQKVNLIFSKDPSDYAVCLKNTMDRIVLIEKSKPPFKERLLLKNDKSNPEDKWHTMAFGALVELFIVYSQILLSFDMNNDEKKQVRVLINEIPLY